MVERKLRIGWFSFSCCEDSTIVFVELMNDNYFKWKDLVDFRHVRVLKANNDMADLDVAFVEGAIATGKDEEELKEIRQNSKRLVAIGSCAVKANPSGQRNDFSEEKKMAIEPYLVRWGLSKRVKALKEVVQVDDFVDGCPMSEEAFLSVLDKYLKEFGVIDAQH